MTEDMISLRVVTKGPAATAGSKESFLRVMGIKVPKQPANVMAKVMERKMIFEMVKTGTVLGALLNSKGIPK